MAVANKDYIYWSQKFGYPVTRKGLPDGVHETIASVSGTNLYGGVVIDTIPNFYRDRLEKVFWIEHASGTIKKADLNGDNETTIVSGLTNPLALAIAIDQNEFYVENGAELYYTTKVSGKYEIWRCDVDGDNKSGIVTAVNYDLPFLAIDIDYSGTHKPSDKKMYFNGSGDGTLICANLDGTGQETITVISAGDDPAVSGFEFTTEVSGFTQTTHGGSITFCMLGNSTVVYQDYYGRIGNLSDPVDEVDENTTIAWGDMGVPMCNQNKADLVPLTWDESIQSGYVFGYADGGQVNEGSVNLVSIDASSSGYTVVSGLFLKSWRHLRCTNLDIFGTGSPTGHILMADYGKACIMSIDGETMTSGTAHTIASGFYSVDVIRIDDRRALLLTTDKKIRLLEMDYDDDTIVVKDTIDSFDGMELSLDANSWTYHSRLVYAGNNKVLAAYIATGDNCVVQVIEVNGAEIFQIGSAVEVSLGQGTPNWNTTHLHISKLFDEQVYIGYYHSRTVPTTLHYSKYRVASIDGIDISLTDECVRYACSGLYDHNTPAIAISPSAILALQTNGKNKPSPDTNVKKWSFGLLEYQQPVQKLDHLAINTLPQKYYGIWEKSLFAVDQTNDEIAKFNQDGTDCQVVVSSDNGLVDPFGIVIDPIASRLYWSDINASTDHIQQSHLDGSESGVVVQLSGSPTEHEARYLALQTNDTMPTGIPIDRYIRVWGWYGLPFIRAKFTNNPTIVTATVWDISSGEILRVTGNRCINFGLGKFWYWSMRSLYGSRFAEYVAHRLRIRFLGDNAEVHYVDVTFNAHGMYFPRYVD